MRSPVTPDLAIVYEHPHWFEPLFAALERRGVAFAKIDLTDHCFDPLEAAPPAPVILSRVAMSGFLRDPEHPIFYAGALLDCWRRKGARVLNGADVVAIDSSKARQLALIAGRGHAIPQTRVVHRLLDVARAARTMRFPLLVKANLGGSGAGIARYSSFGELERSVLEETVPTSIDKVLLVQDYVPPRGGKILRLETLGGRFLYAIEVDSTGESFDLCPADACVARPGRAAIVMTAVTPAAELIDAAEDIAAAIGLDVGGLEVAIDDRDGTPRFYDINALSNFVANPLDVLGWDPHERLVDYLQSVIREVKA
jgi:glutathione synthase/RimK-type ligase-like ATP-grasp enzyme